MRIQARAGVTKLEVVRVIGHIILIRQFGNPLVPVGIASHLLGVSDIVTYLSIGETSTGRNLMDFNPSTLSSRGKGLLSQEDGRGMISQQWRL